MKRKKPLPKFKTEAAERAFWETHDSTAYLEYRTGSRTLFPNLRPSVKTISIRVPESLLGALKMLAHKRDIPYQSLVKIMLAEQVDETLLSRKGG